MNTQRIASSRCGMKGARAIISRASALRRTWARIMLPNRIYKDPIIRAPVNSETRKLRRPGSSAEIMTLSTAGRPAKLAVANSLQCGGRSDDGSVRSNLAHHEKCDDEGDCNRIFWITAVWMQVFFLENEQCSGVLRAQCRQLARVNYALTSSAKPIARSRVE